VPRVSLGHVARNKGHRLQVHASGRGCTLASKWIRGHRHAVFLNHLDVNGLVMDIDLLGLSQLGGPVAVHARRKVLSLRYPKRS